MNGPEVIEQENGIEEFDSSDRALIWAIHGEQRYAMGWLMHLWRTIRTRPPTLSGIHFEGRPAVHELAGRTLSQPSRDARHIATMGSQGVGRTLGYEWR